MGLGDLTKQLAQEAIADALSPAEKTPAPAAVPESAGATIIKQVQAMQGALKEQDELVVLYHNGAEMFRVLDVFQPSAEVTVLAGIDSARNVTRVISKTESLQLTCKVMKAQPGAAPHRIRFITPK